MKSRITTVATLVALTAGTGGALAVASSSPSNSSQQIAANSQYRPGKGCGDKNHHHTGSNGNQKPCPKPHHPNGGGNTGGPPTSPAGGAATGAALAGGAPGTSTATLGPPTFTLNVPLNNEKALNACNGKTVSLSGVAHVLIWSPLGLAQVDFSRVQESGGSYTFGSSQPTPFTTDGTPTASVPVQLGAAVNGSSLTYDTLLHLTFNSNGAPSASFDNNALNCA